MEQAQKFLQRACFAIFACLITATLVWGQLDLQRMHTLAMQRYGQSTANMVDEWHATIESMRAMSDAQKLDTANTFFNRRIRWVQDPEAWGQKDYWATPLETMGNGKGDCEDFAIAKYFMLVLSGMDINKLRITYVKAQMGGPNSQIHAAHMVLAYYPNPAAVPQILDNLITDIYPSTKRTDLTPVYGFNSRGLWVGGAATPATTNPGAKLSRWRGLLQRAANEGMG